MERISGFSISALSRKIHMTLLPLEAGLVGILSRIISESASKNRFSVECYHSTTFIRRRSCQGSQY